MCVQHSTTAVSQQHAVVLKQLVAKIGRVVDGTAKQARHLRDTVAAFQKDPSNGASLVRGLYFHVFSGAFSWVLADLFAASCNLLAGGTVAYVQYVFNAQSYFTQILNCRQALSKQS